MTTNSIETIYPCPLSRGYGIPAQQAWQLLKYFLAYRLLLGCLLLVFCFYNGSKLVIIGENSHGLFLYSSLCYLIFSVISAVCLVLRRPGYAIQAQFLIFTDILILILLMHATGGVTSGFGFLLAVSIASGGLLIGGRCAMFFAAIASLGVFCEQYYAYRVELADITASAFVNAGTLGASFFTIALLSYVLATRSEQMLKFANLQEQTIANLEELNQYIIQHLQSGIIIANRQKMIQMNNEAALRLTNLNAVPRTLGEISEQLSGIFDDWLKDPEQGVVSIQLANHAVINVRFMPLPTHHDFYYMILLEDSALYNQRLQQSKLASLGRLTASIAHEIRNPLSAMSHAGQLLSESPNLTTQDQRLTEIIRTNAGRVNHIIEDILQLSRRKDSRRRKIQLNDWLEEYMKNYKLEQGVADDAFTLALKDNLPDAFIDTDHLKQIMDNLCQNAIRYGKPELGAITLQTLILKNAPCIDVIDNGSGISRENIGHLFEPFFTTSTNGTGLGLYISRELAELNQAKLSYYLTSENRNCFRLCLLNADLTLIEI